MSDILPAGFVTSSFSLDGRVAAVTGGGSGLGAAISAGLAQAGAVVAVLDVDVDKAAGVAAAIADAGAQAHVVECDVTDAASIRAAADQVVELGGGADILVNSAGTAFRCPAEEFPEDQLDRVLTLNLKGTYLSCQAFGRHMLRKGRGNIVNIASIGGFVAYPQATAYLASKGGVVQLTRGLALEWIGKVRVNGIAPTLFDTPLTRQVTRASSVTSEFIEARSLRDELPEPQHVVGAAVFLASDASAMVTGHTLPVDDGYLVA